MLCARALVRALNDAKTRAQQGCAMQFKVAYYSFYEARARATIRLPDVNIARARKTFVSNT